MVALLRDERYDILPLDQVVHGECLSVMRAWPDNCIDSAVLDPPAGISFMNKTFDHDRGGRDKWIAWLADIMREVLRVLRPGSHCLVWSLPRTSHWTGLALEQAGFEMRDCLYHLYSPDSALATFQASLTETQQDALDRLLDSQEVSSSILHLFGSGFPKSLDVGKALHKHLGVEREIVGISPNSRFNNNKMYANGNGLRGSENYKGGIVSISVTPELQQHEGTGSALKPACENWWLCRKPLSEKTIAENVLKHGTGGLNIDKSRVSNVGMEHHKTAGAHQGNGSSINPYFTRANQVEREKQGLNPRYEPLGRFPSHVTFSHSLFCTEDACSEGCAVLALEQQSGVSTSKAGNRGRPWSGKGSHEGWKREAHQGYTDGYSGISDIGTASRFYHTFTPDVPFLYAAKSSRRERNLGCEEMEPAQTFDKNTSKRIAHINHETGDTTYSDYAPSSNQNTHPCVKSQSLMRYLVSLCTPSNGIVLDCFAGSGSTLVAAITEGYHFIGIEMNNTPDEPYVDIARARVQHALAATPLNAWEVSV